MSRYLEASLSRYFTVSEFYTEKGQEHMRFAAAWTPGLESAKAVTSFVEARGCCAPQPAVLFKMNFPISDRLHRVVVKGRKNA